MRIPGIFLPSPMPNFKRILLASHGTEGARAAERKMWRLAAKGARVHHLIIVPDLWKGMRGDDWLNNASTQDDFARYLESELEGEIRREVRRLQRQAARRKIRYTSEILQGKPAECLIQSATRHRPDLVIVGSPRPPGKRGLRSRMDFDRLAHKLTAPLLIVPHPK